MRTVNDIVLYGLNYADTTVVSAKLDKDITYAQAKATELSVVVEVANKGDVATQDVLQVYVHVDDKNEVPNPKLAAFARVKLAAGEKKTVFVSIPNKAFSVVDEDGQSQFSGSKADIYVGFGQPDERTAQLTGKECIQITI